MQHAIFRILATPFTQITSPPRCEAQRVASKPTLRVKSHAARHSASPARTPSLLIFLHIAKTGGTALATLVNGYSWRSLRREREARGDKIIAPTMVDKGMLRCLLKRFPQIFPAFSGACPGLRDARPWYEDELAAELHMGDDFELFWTVLYPALPQLRLLYASHNGSVVLTTGLREPRRLCARITRCGPRARGARAVETAGSDAISMSARIFNEGGQKVRVPSFQEVLLRHTDRVSGYMVRALTADLVAAQRHRPSHKEQKQPLDAIASPPLQEGPSEGPCPTALQRTARERLVAFDVVGVTSCMRDWYDALGRRLRWTCLRDSAVIDAAEKYSHNEYYKPHESNSEVRAFVEASADDELSPDAAAALRSAAACDGPVYLDGLRRAGLLAGPAVSADGEPTDDHHSLADPGGEEAWLREAGSHTPTCRHS